MVGSYSCLDICDIAAPWVVRNRSGAVSVCLLLVCIVLGLAGRGANHEIQMWRDNQEILRRSDVPVFLIGDVDAMPEKWQRVWSDIEVLASEAGPPPKSAIDYHQRRLGKDPERAREFDRTSKPLSVVRGFGGIISEVVQGMGIDFLKRMELLFKVTYFPRKVPPHEREEKPTCWRVHVARNTIDFDCLSRGRLGRFLRRLSSSLSQLMSAAYFDYASMNAPCEDCNILRGFFTYTPKTYISWHTNALDDHGYRGYFTLLRDDDGDGDGGRSYFRWRDFSTGTNHEILLHGNMLARRLFGSAPATTVKSVVDESKTLLQHGLNLVKTGKNDLALMRFRKVLDTLNNNDVVEHSKETLALRAAAGTNAAMTLRETFRTSNDLDHATEAAVLFKNSVKDLEKSVGPKHVRVSKVLGQFSELLEMVEDYEGVEAALRRALTIHAEWGMEHESDEDLGESAFERTRMILPLAAACKAQGNDSDVRELEEPFFKCVEVAISADPDRYLDSSLEIVRSFMDVTEKDKSEVDFAIGLLKGFKKTGGGT
eukprot:g428.t1